MKKNKQYIFIFLVLILAGLVFGVYLVKFYFPQKEELKVYTLDDFPQALARMEQAEAESKIEKLNQEYQSIGNDEHIYPSWINIGLIKKQLGDIQGAEEAWQNALSVTPNSILAHGNLAELYMYEFKDNEKAEEYYKKALELDPANYSFYYELATLYRYRLTEKAHLIEEIMVQGAEKNAKKAEAYYKYLADYFTKEGNNQEKAGYYNQKALEAHTD